MTKLKVVGNSHVAAFKGAFLELADRLGDTQVSYFAAPQAEYSRFRMMAGKQFGLGPGPSPERARAENVVLRINGATETDLSDQDAVFLVDRAGARHYLLSIIAQNDIDGLREVGAPRRMSAAAFDKFLDMIVEASLPAPGWWNWEKQSVFVFPAPLLAETCLRDDPLEPHQYSAQRILAKAPQGCDEVLKLFDSRMIQKFREKGLNYVPQPEETVRDGFLTREEFRTGAIKLSTAVAHPRTDHKHGNARYAETCIAPILTSLGLLSDRKTPG
jgi:hypothetical protein